MDAVSISPQSDSMSDLSVAGTCAETVMQGSNFVDAVWAINYGKLSQDHAWMYLMSCDSPRLHSTVVMRSMGRLQTLLDCMIKCRLHV